jgi:hypothetical protein
MSSLLDIPDIKLGSTQVIELKLGSTSVWTAESDPERIWGFSPPSGGEEIEIICNFAGIVSLNWGDGNTDRLISGVKFDHTY